MICIFCAIINKNIPASLVMESDHVVAFNDINPVASVHVLIVPKLHIKSIYDISYEQSSLLTEIILTANNLAKSYGLDQSGYRIVINTGKDAGQSVDHMHFHMIGGRPLSWPPG
jgi:histidine triad (HIT) family protein